MTSIYRHEALAPAKPAEASNIDVDCAEPSAHQLLIEVLAVEQQVAQLHGA